MFHHRSASRTAVVERTADATAWADAVGRARAERDGLVAAGHRRRDAYSLEASGEALAAAYRRAAEIGARR